MEAARLTAVLGAPASGHAELRARLEASLGEIEEAALARVYAISDPGQVSDPAYAEGLRATVSAALDYALEAIEREEEDEPPPLPRQLLAQARLAARRGVSLDTVLRRYLAGYTLLGDFLAREGERSGLAASAAQLWPSRAALLDRLFATIAAEYESELERCAGRSSAERRAAHARRLLAGEPLDAAELAYDLERFHVGLIVQGTGCEEALRELARGVDCTPLVPAPKDGEAWAWLGTRSPLDPGELDLERTAGDPGLAVALGEPAEGLAGWRLTHRQAAAALRVARRGPGSHARYRDVAILATALEDELLATSLRHLYIAPLQAQRDGGRAAIETLRAYLAAGRNASSAAAALGVNRNTIAERLRAIEAAIGRPVSSCGPELEAALRLAEFRGPVPS